MAKDKEDKLILEREYIVPLRRKFLKTPRYLRTPKAIRELKLFILRHMKVYDKDLNKIKIDRFLNEEMWFRGIRKPYARIKVKCRKYDSGIVKVELVEMPKNLKFKKEREERSFEEAKKIKEEKKKAEESKEEKKEDESEKVEEKEKEKSVVEAGLKKSEEKHKEIKHEVADKREPKHKFRQALQK